MNKSVQRRLGIFNSLVLIFNILFILALCLSYLSVHVSPEKSWILPFFGLLYPYLVIFNLFMVIYWILRRRWLFLLSAITLVAGWHHLDRTIQFRSEKPAPQNRNYFKVTSYNVKNLSNDNVDLLEPEIRNKILRYLDNEHPDILCLQEFSVVHPDPDSFIDSISDRLTMPFHAYTQYSEKPRKRIDAIFIFSKFPILDFHPFEKDDMHNYALSADLLVGNDTVRVFN
ncbi:MAG: hypothetical protein MUC31_01290, partial [Bacteroidales bacterium]|nr:hypothetical protein [Bacteroidales bacterium]